MPIIVPDLKTYKGLKPVYINEVIENSIKLIDEERGGIQNGLKSRWNSLNIIQGKYFRFNEVNLFSSLSSHGKSYIFNIMAQDFSESFDFYNRNNEFIKKGLNTNFKQEYILLYFGFEQDSENEVIRSLSGFTDFSYSKLVSSEYNKEIQEFEDLSDEEFNYVKNQANFLKNRNVFYFNNRGTCYNVIETVSSFQTANLNAKIVVFLDHTFLFQKHKLIKNDGDLIQEVATTAIYLKKKGCMVNILHQMNQNITYPERTLKPELHHPLLSDLYFGAQIYWACDNVYVFPYQPAMINLKTYSTQKLNTTIEYDGKIRNLVVCSKIKSRNGFIAERYFINAFDKGKLIETNYSTFLN